MAIRHIYIIVCGISNYTPEIESIISDMRMNNYRAFFVSTKGKSSPSIMVDLRQLNIYNLSAPIFVILKPDGLVILSGATRAQPRGSYTSLQQQPGGSVLARCIKLQQCEIHADLTDLLQISNKRRIQSRIDKIVNMFLTKLIDEETEEQLVSLAVIHVSVTHPKQFCLFFSNSFKPRSLCGLSTILSSVIY